MKVDFEFDIDEKVITPFEEKGIISMLGFDEGGKRYYVLTKLNSQWLKETELKKA